MATTAPTQRNFIRAKLPQEGKINSFQPNIRLNLNLVGKGTNIVTQLAGRPAYFSSSHVE
jgi:hypothetical protein